MRSLGLAYNDFGDRFTQKIMLHPTVEQRLSVLEKTVTELQNQLNERGIVQSPIANNWLDCLVGSISDDSAFLQALEYGKLYRQENMSF